MQEHTTFEVLTSNTSNLYFVQLKHCLSSIEINLTLTNKLLTRQMMSYKRNNTMQSPVKPCQNLGPAEPASCRNLSHHC